MEELIKYYESVESRLAALDARISELLMRVEVLEEAAEHEAEQEARIAELMVRVEALEAAANQKEEDEVEVELVFNEEEEAVAENPVEEEPEADEEPEAVEEAVKPVSVEEAAEPAAVEEKVEPVSVEEKEEEQPVASEEPAKAPTTFAPVDDLRKAISLGDRFLYVRELFGNQGEKLQIAIDEINKLNSLDEACSWIDKHYHWDKESKAYELFLNALKRRFA